MARRDEKERRGSTGVVVGALSTSSEFEAVDGANLKRDDAAGPCGVGNPKAEAGLD